MYRYLCVLTRRDECIILCGIASKPFCPKTFFSFMYHRGDGFIPFLEEPELFAYSPPGLNHTITFNATAAALLFQGLNEEEEDAFYIMCGIIDGDNPGVPFNPVPVDLHIVPCG